MSYTTHTHCNKCGEELPITKKYFHRNKQTKDGFKFTCKNCISLLSRKLMIVIPKHSVIKECSVCNKLFLPTSEYFYGKSTSYDGLRRECKRCTNRRNSLYYKQNKEVISNRIKIYRQNNKEKTKERSRKYYIKNKLKQT